MRNERSEPAKHEAWQWCVLLRLREVYFYAYLLWVCWSKNKGRRIGSHFLLELGWMEQPLQMCNLFLCRGILFSSLPTGQRAIIFTAPFSLNCSTTFFVHILYVYGSAHPNTFLRFQSLFSEMESRINTACYGCEHGFGPFVVYEESRIHTPYAARRTKQEMRNGVTRGCVLSICE